jgi:hypothetical protein
LPITQSQPMEEQGQRSTGPRHLANFPRTYYSPREVAFQILLASQRIPPADRAQLACTCKAFRKFYKQGCDALEIRLEEAALFALTNATAINLVRAWLTAPTGGRSFVRGLSFYIDDEDEEWVHNGIDNVLAHEWVESFVESPLVDFLDQHDTEVELHNESAGRAVHMCIEKNSVFVHLYRLPVPSVSLKLRARTWSGSRRVQRDPDLPALEEAGLGLLLFARSEDAVPGNPTPARCVVSDAADRDERRYGWRDAAGAGGHVEWALDALWVVASRCRDRFGPASFDAEW